MHRNPYSFALVLTSLCGSVAAFGAAVVLSPGNLHGWKTANFAAAHSTEFMGTHAKNKPTSPPFSGATFKTHKADFVSSKGKVSVETTRILHSIEQTRNFSIAAAGHSLPATGLP